MTILIPMVFLAIGLGLGGGLYYASTRVRSRLQSIEDARPCKAGNPGTGLVKLHGAVKPVNPADVMTSPVDQKPCVYFKLVIEELRQNYISNGTHSTSKSQSGGSWVRIIEDEQAVPMVIADETGEVRVDAKEATLDFQVSRTHANLFSGLPKELEASLRERYKIVTSTAFIPKQMRYTEVVIEPGQEVFAMGECEVKDGQATLVKKDHPLMITFRNEQQVLRNGKITVWIMTALAIVFPLLFIALGFGAYMQVRSVESVHEEGARNAAKPMNDAISKLKDKNASLTDRATAARRLVDYPANKKQAAEVSPYLNPLLESKDSAHRDPAVLAIRQGWGSSANAAALKRVLDNTKDARTQKDLNAALKRVGG